MLMNDDDVPDKLRSYLFKLNLKYFHNNNPLRVQQISFGNYCPLNPAHPHPELVEQNGIHWIGISYSAETILGSPISIVVPWELTKHPIICPFCQRLISIQFPVLLVECEYLNRRRWSSYQEPFTIYGNMLVVIMFLDFSVTSQSNSQEILWIGIGDPERPVEEAAKGQSFKVRCTVQSNSVQFLLTDRETENW